MIFYIAAGIVLLGFFFHWQNNGLVVTRIDYRCAGVPRSFDGFTILHISDLHNKAFGFSQSALAAAMAQARPDMIAVTGDIIDKRRVGKGAALALASQAVKLAPVFFVPGNHEKTASVFAELSARLAGSGVRVMADGVAGVEKNGESITVAGVRDFEFFRAQKDKNDKTQADRKFKRALKSLKEQATTGFCLLLSHRPEKLEMYAQCGFDLVLTGHAHGGQWRLPGIGGLYAPHQGVFPRYTSGLHWKGATGMVVSRGLGNSGFPLRLFNRPELVAVTLRRG